MTQSLPPPIPSLIPETAPFSDEQRVWLNGFFAGLVSLDGSASRRCPASRRRALISGATASKADDDDDGGALWHDQTLPLAERMKLADGKPLRWRMMAAMAQQDCGQCGYDCKDYSGAMFPQGGAAGSVRAGRQGNRPHAQDAIRGIHEHSAAASKAGGGWLPSPAPVAPAVRGSTRIIRRGDFPVADEAQQGRAPRRKPGILSSIFPTAVLITRSEMHLACSRQTIRNWSTPSSRALAAPADFPIGGRTLREVLTRRCVAIARARHAFPVVSYITGGERRKKARAARQPEKIRMGMQKRSMCLPRLRNSPAFGPTRRRSSRRSIRCSRGSIRSHPRPKPTPGRVASDSRCGALRHRQRDARLGVASTFLAERLPPGRCRSRSMCRRRTALACRLILRCRSS